MTTERSSDVSHVHALVLVFVGGAVGTGVREAFALAFPTSVGGFPTTIFLINVVGAFVLGVLLETLSRRGPDEGRARRVRLLLGTGVLGGFTTYSAFAADAAVLLRSVPAVAVLYVAATLVAGLLASIAGVAVGAALHRRIERGRGGA